MTDSICPSCQRVNLHALKAAHTGHLPCLQAAFTEDPDKSCAGDSKGATAVHLSARSGHVECLEWLLKNSGMDAKCKAKNGETAAHLAASQGRLECMKMLYEYDPGTVTTKDRYGQVALHLATLRNKLECVEWLLEDGKNSPRATNQTGATAIHFAAALNDINCAKALLHVAGNKAVNLRDHNGTTPIYFAAQEGHLDMVKFLVTACKGDPLARSSDGMTSVHAATQGGHMATLQWLVKKLGEHVITDPCTDGGTPIHFAAAMGRYDCLKWLLSTKKGKKAVKVTDNEGGTPAHDAADNGQTDCLSLLVDNGADLHVKDKDGYTPYELAVQGGHEDTAEYVIQLTGGDVSKTHSPTKVDDKTDQDVTIFNAWNQPTGQRDASKPFMTPMYSMSSIVSEKSLHRREGIHSAPESPVHLKPDKATLQLPVPDLESETGGQKSRRLSATPSLAEGPPPPEEDDLDLVDPVIPSTPRIAKAQLVGTPRGSLKGTPRTQLKRLTRDMDDEEDPGYAELDALEDSTMLESDKETPKPAVDPDPVYAKINRVTLRRKEVPTDSGSTETPNANRSSALIDALRDAAASEASDGLIVFHDQVIVLESGQPPPLAPPVPLELKSGEEEQPPTPPPSPMEEQSEPPIPPPIPKHLDESSDSPSSPEDGVEGQPPPLPLPPPLPKNLDGSREKNFKTAQPQQLPPLNGKLGCTLYTDVSQEYNSLMYLRRKEVPTDSGSTETPNANRSSALIDALRDAAASEASDGLIVSHDQVIVLESGQPPPLAPPVPLELKSGEEEQPPTPPPSPMEEQSEPPIPPPIPKHLDESSDSPSSPEDGVEGQPPPLPPPLPKNLDGSREKNFKTAQPQQLPPLNAPPNVQALPLGADPMEPLVAMRQQREMKRQLEQQIKQKQTNEQTRGAGSELKKRLIQRQEQHHTKADNQPVEVNSQ